MEVDQKKRNDVYIQSSTTQIKDSVKSNFLLIIMKFNEKPSVHVRMRVVASVRLRHCTRVRCRFLFLLPTLLIGD